INLATVLFSAVALTCGVIASYWLFKIRSDVVGEKHNTYLLSSLISISFLLGFPLWTLFNEFFQFTPATITRISYLLFSIGYFGVFLVSFHTFTEISSMKEYVQKVKAGTKDKKLLSKLRQLELENEELEKFKRLSIGRELKMIELKEEIEKLRRKH
ncbi:hypothetical protein HY501_00500, partial [Candidatus Woesearchaeota archaeon]|nr:hypothetical protein [Candidatus Woesearchaeota archaeon]